MWLHRLYWLLIFSYGIIVLFHLPTALVKAVAPLIVLMLLFKTLLTKDKVVLPYMGLTILFLLFSFFSNRINGLHGFTYIYFLTYTIFSYLYFIVFINTTDINKSKKILRFIIILCLIQIPASIIKFIFIGISESGGIGTIGFSEGSVSAIFPAFMTAILFSYYIFTRKKLYLVLITLFFLMSIIGDKRAAMFLIPLILLIAYSIYIYKLNSRINVRSIKLIFSSVLFGFAIFYLTVRALPSLNYENKSWGSFNISYALGYANNYSSSDSRFKEMRRKDGLVYFINYAIKGDPIRILFGDGAGKLIDSGYSDNSGGTMLESYGVRYGGRMGFIWLILQVGIIGVIIYFILLMKMASFAANNYRQHPLYLSFLVLSFLFLVDSVIYSNVFLRYEYHKGLYFIIFGLIYLDVKFKGKYLNALQI